MVSIREYDSLLEDLQDIATIAERVNEEMFTKDPRRGVIIVDA